MIPEFPTHWGALILRGLVGVFVGLITIAWPGITLSALVLLFGAFALLDGAVHLAGTWRAIRSHDAWGVSLLEGIAGLAAAAVAIAWPAITAIALVYVIGVWSILTGIFELIAALWLRRIIHGEWLLALIGITSVLFGVFLMAAPIAGALTIALWLGAYALISGAILIGLGIRLRSWRMPPSGSSMPLPMP